MVFPELAYLDIEHKFLKNQNKKIEPQLQLKVLDKNIFGKEELGILVLPLTSIPNIGNQKERATKQNMENAMTFFDVFAASGSPQEGKVGYWPLFNSKESVTGVIHMELQSYTHE